MERRWRAQNFSLAPTRSDAETISLAVRYFGGAQVNAHVPGGEPERTNAVLFELFVASAQREIRAPIILL